MKIVFNSLSVGLGGAERVIISLSEYLRDAGNQITIVSAIHPEIKYDIPLYVDVKYIDDTINDMFENKISRFFRRRTKLKKLLIGINPDIVISFLPEPNFMVLSLRRYFDTPIVISVRNDPIREYSNIVFRVIMRYLYPKADGYVFQTDDAKRYFNFSNKINKFAIVIPNPVNKEFVRKPYIGVRSNEIVAVGRLRPQKNHRLLITAFSMLSEQFRSYNLVIYGEGPLRQSLEDYIRELDLEKRIILKGKQKNISKLIYKASVFVLSSDYEGMPNALIEAMCLGLPVVSTDCPAGGPAYLIEHEVNGLLCNVDDPADLKCKIESILSDQNKMTKFSSEASKLIDVVDSNKIGAVWVDYINKINNDRKSE
jgi:GalNAc-alpha-(1->4)-GalNAc-alpha-(1->3)-diNAcBac-PP-undecaprenol alpha-1,4-N-acetyl-D-galactosaminyltransferase